MRTLGAGDEKLLEFGRAYLDVNRRVALIAATFARMISRVKLFVSQLFAGN
jgi:hypothetical protein